MCDSITFRKEDRKGNLKMQNVHQWFHIDSVVPVNPFNYISRYSTFSMQSNE